MNKIINVKKAVELSSKFNKRGASIVLAGGVFDLLHVGHVKFLELAKGKGDYLLVLLESDESVRKSKGIKRPLNKQKDRAKVLEALSAVDFIVSLKGILKNEDYDKIVRQISPKVLATTAQDQNIIHKKRQAKLIGAKVETVMKRLQTKSTSKLLKKI